MGEVKDSGRRRQSYVREQELKNIYQTVLFGCFTCWSVTFPRFSFISALLLPLALRNSIQKRKCFVTLVNVYDEAKQKVEDTTQIMTDSGRRKGHGLRF